MYYNTTHETQEQCKIFDLSNMSQTDRVLKLITDRAWAKFSASKIYRNYPIAATPLTSIRRALHTLHHKLGKIRATGTKIEGFYGRKELEYELETQLDLL